MINLDNSEEIKKTQGGDAVLTSVDSLIKQLTQSFTEASSVVFPEEYKNVRNVVVCGMGGSRFPGLILNFLFKDNISVPYTVNDDYILPGYVNKDTLVILSSYSGTTEEVIHCAQEAVKRGAKVTGVTSGGEVKNMLESLKAPAYYFNPVHNPSGQPRIGFGYLVGGHLGLLKALSFITVTSDEINSALTDTEQIVESFKISVATKDNPAKQISAKIYGRYPYYIVSEFLTGVGNAIGNQTNETAKSISSFRVIPELNHHLMEGLKFPTEHNKMALFVFFYSTLYSEQIKKRFAITKDVVEQNGIETLWYELKGKTKVEQSFELMGLGGYITMYLAALYEQDPTIIPYVDYFKKKLKEI